MIQSQLKKLVNCRDVLLASCSSCCPQGCHHLEALLLQRSYGSLQVPCACQGLLPMLGACLSLQLLHGSPRLLGSIFYQGGIAARTVCVAPAGQQNGTNIVRRKVHEPS